MPSIDLTGYHLTFDDEFNARSISQKGQGTTWADIRSEWRFDANSDIGFGHSSFVDSNSGYDPFKVGGGALTITAVPDQTPYGYPKSWESGLIQTKASFAQTYGYFEVRADFSNQKGAWDAFWLLPVTQLPDPNKAGNWQELDVVEHYADNDRGVYSTIHTTDPQNGVPWQVNRQVYSEMANSSGYHTYGVNWQKDTISFYVDGKLVGTQATPSDMHSPMYMLVDLATQGSGTNNADTAGVPISSSIDYVRAYSNDPNAVAVMQQGVSAPDGHDPGLYGASVAAAPIQQSSTGGAGGLSGGTSTSTTGTTSSAASGSGSGTAAIDSSVTTGGATTNGTATGGVTAGTSADASSGHATDARASTSSAPVAGMPNTDGKLLALYDGLLERAPDAMGASSWSYALDHGASLHDIAQSLLNSAEGQLHFNPASSNSAFVEELYGKVLGRPSTAAETQSWAAQLDGGLSRADVATSFVFSSEHLGQLQQSAASTDYLTGTTDAALTRLYYGVLNRAPDANGFQGWQSAAHAGSTLPSIAQAFLNSSEYMTSHANQTNDQFVTSLYASGLGRAPDALGKQGWLSALSHGVSQADVAVGILGSTEAQHHLASQVVYGLLSA